MFYYVIVFLLLLAIIAGILMSLRTDKILED